MKLSIVARNHLLKKGDLAIPVRHGSVKDCEGAVVAGTVLAQQWQQVGISLDNNMPRWILQKFISQARDDTDGCAKLDNR